MKAKTFGGVIWFPQHPLADMHGLLRCVIRTKDWDSAVHRLLQYGVNIAGLHLRKLWSDSLSHIEIAASQQHYGEALGCPLYTQYLIVGNYEPFPKSLLKKGSAK